MDLDTLSIPAVGKCCQPSGRDTLFQPAPRTSPLLNENNKPKNGLVVAGSGLDDNLSWRPKACWQIHFRINAWPPNFLPLKEKRTQQLFDKWRTSILQVLQNGTGPWTALGPKTAESVPNYAT